MTESKKPLDTVVKLAIGVLIGSFALIWGGMFLTRPDRSIPPYSIGSQEGEYVAVHVPSWTSDPEIETLIQRFGKFGRETRDFGPMKIRPTTPDDPKGRYRRMTMYVFTNEAWTEPELFHRYLGGDEQTRRSVNKSVRGWYRLDEAGQEGRIGPVLAQGDTAATAAYARAIFTERLDGSASGEGGAPASSPSPPSVAPATTGP